jgi:hypothetical protein
MAVIVVNADCSGQVALGQVVRGKRTPKRTDRGKSIVFSLHSKDKKGVSFALGG